MSYGKKVTLPGETQYSHSKNSIKICKETAKRNQQNSTSQFLLSSLLSINCHQSSFKLPSDRLLNHLNINGTA